MEQKKYMKISLKMSQKHLLDDLNVFSSKRWKFKGKIKPVSKLMPSFLMFVGKKEGTGNLLSWHHWFLYLFYTL